MLADSPNGGKGPKSVHPFRSGLDENDVPTLFTACRGRSLGGSGFADCGAASTLFTDESILQSKYMKRFILSTPQHTQKLDMDTTLNVNYTNTKSFYYHKHSHPQSVA